MRSTGSARRRRRERASRRGVRRSHRMARTGRRPDRRASIGPREPDALGADTRGGRWRRPARSLDQSAATRPLVRTHARDPDGKRRGLRPPCGDRHLAGTRRGAHGPGPAPRRAGGRSRRRNRVRFPVRSGSTALLDRVQRPGRPPGRVLLRPARVGIAAGAASSPSPPARFRRSTGSSWDARSPLRDDRARCCHGAARCSSTSCRCW